MTEKRPPTYNERLMIENVCEEAARKGLLVWTGMRDEHGCKVWRGAGAWKYKGAREREDGEGSHLSRSEDQGTDASA